MRVQTNNQNIEKVAFKVVQIKFEATHITNKKRYNVNIYTRKFTKIALWNMSIT